MAVVQEGVVAHAAYYFCYTSVIPLRYVPMFKQLPARLSLSLGRTG